MTEWNDIHPAAARGYQNQASAYERGRPAYPSSATDFLLSSLNIHLDTHVIELGAGTGKFTRVLVATRARVTAVEPVESMRTEFARHLPRTRMLHGRAEDLPLPDGDADVVVVAQAFHWFDALPAAREIHRVLKPGGRLGLIWNVRDETASWVAELTRIIDEYAGSVPRYRTGAWKEAFGHTSLLFSALESREFHHVHTGPVDMVIDRMASISFIAALPAALHARVLERTRHLLDTHPQTRGRDKIDFPYRCDVYWCTRKETDDG